MNKYKKYYFSILFKNLFNKIEILNDLTNATHMGCSVDQRST